MTASDPPIERQPGIDGDNVAEPHGVVEDTDGVHGHAVHAGTAPPDRSHEPPYTHTRLSGYWAAMVVGLLVLLVLIIFILENTKRVEVSFFGAHAHLSLGIALSLAAVIGGLVVVFAGTARILQLRARAHRTARSADRTGRRRRKR